MALPLLIYKENNMFKPQITIILFTLAVFCFIGSVQCFAGSYVGKKIKKISKDAESQYLSQNDLIELINGKTVIGVTVKSRNYDNYVKQTFKEDGNIILEVYKDSNNTFVKSIPGRKWSVKEDGTLCIDINGKACKNKLNVIKVEEKYLSVDQKKGKVALEWELVK